MASTCKNKKKPGTYEWIVWNSDCKNVCKTYLLLNIWNSQSVAKMPILHVSLVSFHMFKGAQCSLGGYISNQWRKIFIVFLCIHNLTKQTDLKGQHHFIFFYFVYIVADPATFFSLKQWSGDLIFVWEQLVYSVMETIYTPEYVLLPH